MYKKILTIIFFFFSISVFADEKILECGDNKYKIKLPLVGFDKIFIEKKKKWKRIKSFEISEEFYIVKKIPTMQKKCVEEKCNINIFISKELTGSKHLEYTVIADTEFCKIDGFNINKFLIQEEGYDCFKRKKGASLEKGYCEILEE